MFVYKLFAILLKIMTNHQYVSSKIFAIDITDSIEEKE